MRTAKCWLLGFALVVATGCTAPGPAAPAPVATPEPLTLTIGWGVTPITASPASVLWLARDLGSYAREGLNPDLQLIQGTPNLIAGMRAGQIDVAVLTAYEAVLLTATRSLEMKMIGGSGAAGQNNTFMVVSRDSVGSLEDLHGKATVTTCPLELAELYRDRLQSCGLTATIQPA